MTSDPGNRLSDLYHRALERAPEERRAYLDEACAGDDGLREQVESLLRYESASARFLERPAAAVVPGAGVSTQMVGRQLGPYTILALLGAGGMGRCIARGTPSSAARWP